MAEHSKSSTPPVEPFDDREIQLKPILNTGLGILIITIVSMVVVYYMAKHYVQKDLSLDTPKTPIQQTLGTPQLTGPRLQELPEGEWDDLKSGWEEALHSYAWVDEANGIARLPIHEAMELVAERYAHEGSDLTLMVDTTGEVGEVGTEPAGELEPTPEPAPESVHEPAAAGNDGATHGASHE